MILMQTRLKYLEVAEKELGAIEFKSMFHMIDNEYYALIEKEVKSGKSINQDVYESLTEGQRFHFNKHYNHRGDKVQKKMTKYNGFLANTVSGEKKIATAREGKFFNGYTTMNLYDLNEGVEGKDALLDANLKELVKHKESLKSGKRVDIHLEWELSEDKSKYLNVHVLKVEVVEDSII